MSFDPSRYANEPLAVFSTAPSQDCKRITADREVILRRSTEIIHSTPPLVTSGELGCIFPRTINTIQGRKGVHKSRLTETIFATLLGRRGYRQHLGFVAQGIEPLLGLYVDTERNQQDQFPLALQRIKRLAGYDYWDHPTHLDAISLIGVERKLRFEALSEYLERNYAGRDEPVVIVLDVASDCVVNFNDPVASMQLLDMMNDLINTKNVTFLVVIHENPNDGGKARGHLGTELINKSSQVISIGFERDARGNDTDLVRIKFLHSRSTRRLDTLYARYSEEAHGLVLADEGFVQATLDTRKTKASPAELELWLIDHLRSRLSKTDLMAQLTEAFACGERILEERLKELVEQGKLERTQEKRKVYYQLPSNLLSVPF